MEGGCLLQRECVNVYVLHNTCSSCYQSFETDAPKGVHFHYRWRKQTTNQILVNTLWFKMYQVKIHQIVHFRANILLNCCKPHLQVNIILPQSSFPSRINSHPSWNLDLHLCASVISTMSEERTVLQPCLLSTFVHTL